MFFSFLFLIQFIQHSPLYDNLYKLMHSKSKSLMNNLINMLIKQYSDYWLSWELVDLNILGNIKFMLSECI